MENLNIEQIQQLEYLLTQSAAGNHILFDMDEIKNAFNKEVFREKFSFKKIDRMKKMMEKLIALPTLDQKKEFLTRLSPDSKKLIIRAYFNILETTLSTNNVQIH